jgi:hypothetical protein
MGEAPGQDVRRTVFGRYRKLRVDATEVNVGKGVPSPKGISELPRKQAKMQDCGFISGQ